jgi:predicted metal-binding protein
MEQRRPRKITLEVDEDQFDLDMESYRQKALDLGAGKARIVRSYEIPVDERVTLKCLIPRCPGYGTGANCPPHTLKPAELRTMLEKYHRGIFFTKEVPPGLFVRDAGTTEERAAAYEQVYNLVAEIESMACYDGYYLAFGLGAGSCRDTFCGPGNGCAVLERGECRFSLRARPSMEAVGIDVYRMVAVAGWDMYPIGSDARAKEAPSANLAGLVIVR